MVGGGATADATSLQCREALLEVLPRLHDTVSVAFWEDAYEDLLPKLARLGPDALVVYNGVLRYRDNHPVGLVPGLEALRDRTRVPVYSYWDFFMGHGIAGGRLISARSQGAGAPTADASARSSPATPEAPLMPFISESAGRAGKTWR